MKNIIKQVVIFLYSILNDLVFFAGAIFITIAAYKIHEIIGLLVTGVFFIFTAILMSRRR
ncbi:hypothetical protein SA286_10345 [Bacillus altitudinis]|uniref:hypothetical protein n=1 Tax=Bacillus altitudinis TaxID=293387 RepID=UPI001569DE26|nr:hypothetical protein [Bacillus altitudinis]QKJ41715.1 hypothetical protein HRJ37_16565 [Bacillus altitudinis]WRO24368.1 hypothetical protein SA286_10345 [Bacillus altitudinis]